MSDRLAAVRLTLVSVLLAALVACTPASSVERAHDHSRIPAGDGTERSVVGYSLDGLTLPGTAGTPGRYSFRIGTFRGTAQTEFLTEQTKRMHVYVVRDDLAVFRHLHPTMAGDGTWSGSMTLAEPGRYRLVTEFVADDDGGLGDQVILGDWATVGPPTAPVPVPAAATSASAMGLDIAVRTGPTLTVAVSKDGTPAELGTYLGVYAHVTGFQVATGAVVHLHALGAPDDGVLTFHSAFPAPGDYRLFVQVRVSGLVRTVPITVTAS